MRIPRGERLGISVLGCLFLAAAVAVAGTAVLAGCASSSTTTTSVSAGPFTTVPMTAGPGTASTTSPEMTSTTSAYVTTESTVETIVEKPVKPPADILLFSWEAKAYWAPGMADDLSGADKDLRPEGARIVGDPHLYTQPGEADSFISATGEDGKLVVFSLFAEADSRGWTVVTSPAPTGRPLRELLGGRAFNNPGVASGTGADKIAHVFATDTADNLIHFWFTAGGLIEAEAIKSENLTSATGVAVARVGSARVAKDGTTLEVCALDPDDELLYFRLASGGSWSVENPSKQTGRVAKKEATFFADPLGLSDTTIASSCLLDHLLLYRRLPDDTWMLEDITQETTTEKSDPKVTLGGWLSWWDWASGEYWDPSQFRHPLAILTTEGHFQLLERASTEAPWKVTDVSALTGVSFAANGGGDSIIRVHTPRGGSSKEAHFAGVDKAQNLIHFWRDSKGRWHTEDVTAKTHQKFSYPLDESGDDVRRAALGTYAAIHVPGPVAAGKDTARALSGVDPDGRLIVLWAPSKGGDWQVFDATAAMGYRVRGPDLVWSDPFWNNLVMAGSK